MVFDLPSTPGVASLTWIYLEPPELMSLGSVKPHML